jgi:hypothetical protein
MTYPKISKRKSKKIKLKLIWIISQMTSLLKVNFNFKIYLFINPHKLAPLLLVKHKDLIKTKTNNLDLETIIYPKHSK